MKLHLPLNLLSALLACCAALSASVQADPLTITTNQTFDTDVTWNEATTIGANDLTLTIEAGKTLTQAEGAFNVGDNSLTITGGGVFKIETAATVKAGNGSGTRTLTIDNATLDLSSPGASLSMKGDNYTRYKVTVTNGGVLRVGEYAYGVLDLEQRAPGDYQGKRRNLRERPDSRRGRRRRGGGECRQHHVHHC